MNYLYILFFLLAKDNCHEKYLTEILKNPIENGYFLVIKAKKEFKTIQIVLTNIDLANNLKRNNSFLNEEIKRKILSDEILLTVNSKTEYFTTVKQDKKIIAIKNKGEKYFIDYFFDRNGYLKTSVAEPYPIGQIIEILFNWNVLMSNPEGNIYIDKRSLCD